MKKTATALALLMVLCAGCATTGDKTPDVRETDIAEAKPLLKIIETFNNTSPESYIAQISSSASLGGRSFKANGYLFFNNNPLNIKISLHDIIFRTTLIEALLKDDLLKVLSPLERTLYVQDGTSAFSNHADVQLNAFFLGNLAAGHIPVIDNAKPSKVYTDEEGGYRVLVLENERYFESISFKGELPGKIMIIDKGTKSKCEIHYAQPVTFSGKTFFSEVKAQSEPSGNMITINISSIKAGLGGQSADQVFLLNIPVGYNIVDTTR